MKASTTNGVEAIVKSDDDMTPGERIVDCLEKRIRNLEKRKTKLDVIQKEALRGKEIHPAQQEALDKRDEVVNQIDVLKELHEQNAKIVTDAKRAEKKEKDKARRSLHSAGVDKHSRIIRLLQIAKHLDHDQFVRDLADKAPLQCEFLLSVLSLLAGLDEATASTTTEWQAQAMHALFDCPDTLATSAKAPVFDSCKHVNVKQARELLDLLFSGVLDSVSVEGMRTSSSSPPPQTPNPSMNGDGLALDGGASMTGVQRTSTVGDLEGFSPPEANGFDVDELATDIGQSKMLYAADLEQEILQLEQRRSSSVRVPSPPPRIVMPGELLGDEATLKATTDQPQQTVRRRASSPTVRRPVPSAKAPVVLSSEAPARSARTDRRADTTATTGRRTAESKKAEVDTHALIMVPGVGCVSLRTFEDAWMEEPWPVRAQADLLAEEESRYCTIATRPTRNRRDGRAPRLPENMHRNKAARRHANNHSSILSVDAVQRRRRHHHSNSSYPSSPNESTDRALHPPFVCPIVDTQPPVRPHTPIVQFGNVTVNEYNDDCVIIDESPVVMKTTKRKASNKKSKKRTDSVVDTSFIVSAYPERKERLYSRGSMLACNTGHPGAVPLGALNTGRYVKTCSGQGAVNQLVHKPLTAFQYYMGVLHGINTLSSVPMAMMNEYGDDYYPEQGTDLPI